MRLSQMSPRVILSTARNCLQIAALIPAITGQAGDHQWKSNVSLHMTQNSDDGLGSSTWTAVRPYRQREHKPAHFDVFPWDHAERITDKISRGKQSCQAAGEPRPDHSQRVQVASSPGLTRDHPGAAHAAQAKERVSTVEGRW